MSKKSVVNLPANWKEFIPTALLFYTIVVPKRARTRSEGGLILAQQTVDVEKMTTTVGQVVHLGTLAYQSVTPGLDYRKEVNKPDLGEWVLYQKHAGIKVVFAIDKSQPVDDPENRVELVGLTDSDLIWKLTEKQVDHLVGWVQ